MNQAGRVGETLVEFLRLAVERHGPRDALLLKPAFRYLRWSYRRLWEESGRMASLLQSRGLKKGDRVVVWGPNSPQWVIIFFGCIRAGVVAVPLDVRSEPDYVEKVVSRTDPKLAFTSAFTPKGGVELGVPEIAFEELEESIRGMPPPEPVEIAPDDLVEIMFTSGTTGDPKGVMITHRNLTANIVGVSAYIGVKPSSRLLSILPLSHMYEQMGGLLVTLYHGASVTYPISRRPTVLAQTMRERRVTIMLLVPQGLELLMNGVEREVKRQGKEALWNKLHKIAEKTPFPLRRYLFGRVHRQFGGKLDFIVSGGAALDPDLGRKWEAMGGEDSPGLRSHRGLSGDKQPLYKGKAHGLHRAPSAQRGGEDRPRRRNPGPWRQHNAGLLEQPRGHGCRPSRATGTRRETWGSSTRTDFLHIQGRKKDMIALPSGQNVFPEDVEAALTKHPNVTDAAVVGLERGSSIEVHAALILDDADAAPDVVSWANGRLAEQQRVRGFTVWPDEDFPRTHTLKVKKNLVIDTILGRIQQDAPAASASRSPAGEARGLRDVVADVSKRSVEELHDDLSLGDDLKLDSLGRIELLSAIEADLDIYLDESQLGAGTTLRELSDLVEEGSRNPVRMHFPAWGMRWWCRMLRGFLQRTVVFPLVSLPYGLKVVGRENLEEVTGPVLFASNHNLGLDNPLIIKAVPLKWRRRMAVAGAANLWRNPVWWIVNPLLGNAFPLATEGPVRPSLENMGKIIDNGWSVLIYPEGELTVGGPIKPFMRGAGLVAVEGQIPVVPLRLHIHDLGSPARFPLFRRGRVEVRLGEPLSFSPGTDYEDATWAIENAVKSL